MPPSKILLWDNTKNRNSQENLEKVKMDCPAIKRTKNLSEHLIVAMAGVIKELRIYLAFAKLFLSF